MGRFKNNYSLYNYLVKYNLFDKLTWFNQQFKWDKKSAIEASKKYTSKKQLKEKQNGLFKFLNRNKLWCETPWLNTKALSTTKWNDELAIEESKKYISKTKFKKYSSGAYYYFERNNLWDKAPWLNIMYQSMLSKK